MAGQQRGLLRRGGADAVAAVVEHEPLLAGDAVAPEPALHLDRELLHRLTRSERRRRAEHERDRAGQVPALVRVRAADVAEQQILLAEVLLHPGGVDERRDHSAETTERSAATPGRSEHRSSQSAVAGPSSRPKRSSPRRIQGT